MQPVKMNPKDFQTAQDSKPPVTFWNSTWTILIAFCVIGPFAMPLLWRNPRFSVPAKVIGSLAMIGITIALVVFAGKTMSWAMDQIPSD